MTRLDNTADGRPEIGLSALIRKCVECTRQGENTIPCWGTGEPSREFLYVDDAAEGIVVAAEKMDEPIPINLAVLPFSTIHCHSEKTPPGIQKRPPPLPYNSHEYRPP